MATWHEVMFRQEWVPLGTFWSLDWDSPDDTLEATVTARDRMELLRKGTYQTSSANNRRTIADGGRCNIISIDGRYVKYVNHVDI